MPCACLRPVRDRDRCFTPPCRPRSKVRERSRRWTSCRASFGRGTGQASWATRRPRSSPNASTGAVARSERASGRSASRQAARACSRRAGASGAPTRSASLERRRLLACSGPLPPQLAARFTEGQRAVLRIVGDEVAAKGVCGLCIDAIAARAGVCRRLAQGAIRLAEGDGLLTIEERRHEGRKNSPNLVRIISREWQAWMRRGGGQKRSGFAVGCRGQGHSRRP